MFGKLMKYELRYLIRIFAPMWAAVLALCVLCRLTIHPSMNAVTYVEGNEAILPVVLMMATVFAIITMLIVAMVVLLQRFYKGMYGDEGYLMFTLPVTTGGLIHSKALSAMLMLIVSELVMFLGIMIMMSYPEIWSGIDGLGMTIPELWNAFMDSIDMGTMQFVLIVFWALIAFLIVTAEGIYMIYLAISLGQLWKKHPVAGAVVAYYVLNIVINGVETLAARMIGGDAFSIIMNTIPESMDYKAGIVAILLYVTVKSLILLAASFFGTKVILDKKLNIA